MKKLTRVWKLCCVVALAFAAPTALAAPVAVNSLLQYNAATGTATATLDTFDGSSLNAVSLTTDIGIISALENGTPFSPPDNYYNDPAFGSSEFGFALDRTGSVATRNVRWTFPEPVIGFYGEFVSVTGIDASIDGGTTWFDISVTITGDPTDNPINPVNGFFGIVDTAGFTDALFRVDPSFGSPFDSYWLTEMAITPVPEPSAAVFLMAGCLALLSRRRRV